MKMMAICYYVVIVFLAFLDLGFICIVQGEASKPVDFSNYTLIRMTPSTENQLNVLHELRDALKLSYWNEPRAISVPILTPVSPNDTSNLLSSLKSHQIRFKIVSRNLQELIDNQRPQFSTRQQPCGTPNINMYHPYDDLVCIYQAMAKANPREVSFTEIGRSLEGRSIYALRISKGGTQKPPAIFEFGMHAREWISQATGLWLANYFNKNLATWMRKWDAVFLVVSNPDGYVYSWTRNRMHRKNLRQTGYCANDPAGYSSPGVDLNRNFDAKFSDNGGASDDPCDQTYRGQAAFSEPETQAIKNYITRLQSSKQTSPIAYFSIHSYSQMWMYPYGYTEDPAPNKAELDRLSKIAAQAIYQTHQKQYKTGQSSTTVYKTTGCSYDWAYLTGITAAFSIELRDTGNFGFLLPPNEIKPQGEELANAIIYVMSNLAR